MIEFCIFCSAKATYEVSRPRFCPACGKPFNRVEAAKPVASKPSRLKSRRAVEEDDDEEFEEETPFIDDLSVSEADWAIEIHQPNKFTFGDLYNMSQPKKTLKRKEFQPGLSGDDLIKTSMRECGSKEMKEIGG